MRGKIREMIITELGEDRKKMLEKGEILDCWWVLFGNRAAEKGAEEIGYPKHLKGEKLREAKATTLSSAARDVFFFRLNDVALNLLKRHSGIVWDPGRSAGLLRGGNVWRLENPAGAPALGLTPCDARRRLPLLLLLLLLLLLAMPRATQVTVKSP